MAGLRFTLTNDLHLDLGHLWNETLPGFLDRLERERSLRLILAGDLVSFAENRLDAAFRALAPYGGQILYIPGNHELWTEGGDSRRIYEETIPALCRRHGVHLLDEAPWVEGGVAVVGNVGWYDYSFQNGQAGFPQEWYEDKRIPGQFEWMDRRYIRWSWTDAGFTGACCRRLEAQLSGLPGTVETVLAVTHHLPFPELLVRKSDPQWSFGNAFMGSGRIGGVLRRFPRVRLLYCGHSHAAVRAEVGGIRAASLGGNYRAKVLETIEV